MRTRKWRGLPALFGQIQISLCRSSTSSHARGSFEPPGLIHTKSPCGLSALHDGGTRSWNDSSARVYSCSLPSRLYAPGDCRVRRQYSSSSVSGLDSVKVTRWGVAPDVV